MNVLDFEYDNLRLSDFGYIICDFNNSGVETSSNGSIVTLNTVPIYRGAKHVHTHSSYEECITATFSICKNPCLGGNDYLSTEDIRELSRWLNREECCKFRLLSDGYECFYYEGTFTTINQVRNGYNVLGLELTFTSNSPFAMHDYIEYNFTINSVDTEYTLVDISDKIGFSYLETTITCLESGDLTIRNLLEDRQTTILGCSQGEVITLKHPTPPVSSDNSHDIANNFNYNYPRIANTATNRSNPFTFSLPCEVTFKYIPLMKVGI